MPRCSAGWADKVPTPSSGLPPVEERGGDDSVRRWKAIASSSRLADPSLLYTPDPGITGPKLRRGTPLANHIASVGPGRNQGYGAGCGLGSGVLLQWRPD